jgi:peptidoglycan/LPS O-acetylase OafA/YrhL
MDSLSATPAREVPRALGHRPVLDGLRGLAVLVVIALHVGLLAAGFIGVDIFFALSGFLITALLYDEHDRAGMISLRRFYARRAQRLLPALAALAVGFALVVLVLDPFPGMWPLGRLEAVTLLCLNNWVTAIAPGHGHVLGPLSPTWTLAEEVQFYLLWPAALWGLLRLRARPRTVLMLLAIAIVALIGTGTVARYAVANYNAYTSPIDRGAELLLGAAAAIAWRERLIPRILGAPIAGLLLAAGLTLLLATAAPPVWSSYLPAAALTALLIVNLLGGRGRVLDRALRWRPLRHTGRLSYGIYLYHLPIYWLLWTYVPGRSPLFYAPIVLAISMIAATASWRLIEAPVVRGRKAMIPTDNRSHDRYDQNHLPHVHVSGRVRRRPGSEPRAPARRPRTRAPSMAPRRADPRGGYRRDQLSNGSARRLRDGTQHVRPDPRRVGRGLARMVGR